MAKSSIPPEKDPMAWRKMARDDVAGAEILAGKLGELPSLSWEVGLHSQQAVEKFLKAVLFASGIIPLRTHDIAYLLRKSMEFCPELTSFKDDILWFTQLASEARYPGGFDLSPDKAKDVLQKAKEVEGIVEQWFRELEGNA